MDDVGRMNTDAVIYPDKILSNIIIIISTQFCSFDLMPLMKEANQNIQHSNKIIDNKVTLLNSKLSVFW